RCGDDLGSAPSPCRTRVPDRRPARRERPSQGAHVFARGNRHGVQGPYMTDVVVDSIVSARDFGTIFAGHLEDGSPVRVKAGGTAMLGIPTVGELWSIDGELRQTRFGPQISATRAVRALPRGEPMIGYLAGCVVGIGPARARRLWEKFDHLLPEVL